jgi:CBS domain-containing membrane protein
MRDSARMTPFRLLLAGAHWPSRLLACAGAAIGIALTMVACARLPLQAADLPVIVAPLGASAVLVFAVPASPLAQPWPVVGGNVVSSLIGVAAFRCIPEPTVAAGAAVGLAILAMSLLRCLHPPGGAAALTAVIGSEGIHAAGYGFAVAPVAVNSIALVAIGMLFHRLGGHGYPHRSAAAAPIALRAADVDAALDEMGEAFDIAREDLAALLERAQAQAQARQRGGS